MYNLAKKKVENVLAEIRNCKNDSAESRNYKNSAETENCKNISAEIKNYKKKNISAEIRNMFQLNSKIRCDFFSIFVHCGDSDLLSTHLYFEREVKSSFCFSAL